MDSSSMFVTMSCFSGISLFSPCKEKNYAAAPYSFLMKIAGGSISFDIIIYLEIFMIICLGQKNHEGLNQWALVPLGWSLIPKTVLNHQNFTKKTFFLTVFTFNIQFYQSKQTLIKIHLYKRCLVW